MPCLFFFISLSLSLSLSLVSYIESRITHDLFLHSDIYILKECALLCSCAFSHNEKSSSIRFFTDFCFFFSYLLGKKKIPCLHVPTLHVYWTTTTSHSFCLSKRSPLRMEITRRPWRYYYTHEVHSNQVRSPGRPTSQKFSFYSCFCNSNPKLIQQKFFFKKKDQKQTW